MLVLPFVTSTLRPTLTYAAWRHMLHGRGPVVIGRNDLDITIGPFTAKGITTAKSFDFVFRPKPNGNFKDVFSVENADGTTPEDYARRARELLAALAMFPDTTRIEWEALYIRVDHIPDHRLTICNDQNFQGKQLVTGRA